MNNFTDNLINKIESKNIKPRPKFTFLLKDITLFLISTISLIIGSLAFAVIFYMIDNNNWDLYSKTNGNFLKFLLLSLPYLWLLLLSIFIWLSIYYIRHIKGTYKYRASYFLFIVILANIIFGFIFYNFGLGRTIEMTFYQHIPHYRTINEFPFHIWKQSNKNILTGTIIGFVENKKFILIDSKQQNWIVDYQTARSPLLNTGLPVKMLGEKTSENSYRAEIIKPLFPTRKSMIIKMRAR